jgi:hypothetical protein
MKKATYIGSRFSMLLVRREWREVKSGANRIIVECSCDCGGSWSGHPHALTSGGKVSCGCATNNAKKHGHARDSGSSLTYKSWQCMRARMLPSHKHFKNYAGRGISICERWSEFENFLADMGERLPGMTLDRIDNNGNYEPGNCKWSTKKEQQRNRRDTVMLTVGGVTMSVIQWSEKTGADPAVVKYRISVGVDPERAIDPKSMMRSGGLAVNSKLTTEQVVEVRLRRSRGESISRISKEYGMSTASIGDMCAGRTWKNTGGPLTTGHRRAPSEESKRRAGAL